MDLLSLVAQTTKRKGDFFSQAENLARKAKTQSKLELLMAKEAKALVKAFRDKEIRWEEYSRSLIDKTLVSALAAVYLGAKDSSPLEKVQKAWPTVVGDMLPPLKEFLDETEMRVSDGTLLLGDQSYDFADFNLGDPAVQAAIESSKPRGIGQTWPGLLSRVVRYISSPAHSFYALGEYLKRSDMGYKEMRRVATLDHRTCPDCVEFQQRGWQPMGSLPMPGRQCRCYDRCRCHIEYR